MAYFETLKVLDGKVINEAYHIARARHTQKTFYGRATFSELAWENVKFEMGIYRLRVDYAEEVKSVTVHPYTLLEHSVLPLQEVDQFTYEHKAADRRFFSQSLEQHNAYSDILFHRNGLLLDTTICNLAFSDGKAWFTPETYLLPGTKRAYLLDEGRLNSRKIHLDHLSQYRYIAFINALRDFEKIYRFEVKNDRVHLESCPSSMEANIIV
jgi:4-amino-4-deoxychorismate lyase